jgi:hypothetical protein
MTMAKEPHDAERDESAGIGQRSRSIGITAPIASASADRTGHGERMARSERHSARSTAPRRRSCMPSATANSQPIPGLMPWKGTERHQHRP